MEFCYTVLRSHSPTLTSAISTIFKGFYCSVYLFIYLFFVQMTGNNFWLKKIEISVSEAEKRTGRNAVNMQETYTAYLIETRWVARMACIRWKGSLTNS
jgi:hypothetical protein